MTEMDWEGRTAEQWRQLLGLPEVQLFDTTPSTNDVAIERAEAGAASLTLVVADHQTSGRGRGGSDWLSAPGSSLLFSMIFRTDLTEQHAPGAAPIRIGSAVAESIELLIDRKVGLKWPNDVVITGQGKIAGILCEGSFRQGRGFIVAGIGVNVFYPGDEYFSIADATDEPPLRGALLQAIVSRLAELAPRIADPLSVAELRALHARDVLFDQQVKTEGGVVGRACGILPDGSLRIETDQGIQAVRTATVRLAQSGAYPGADT